MTTKREQPNQERPEPNTAANPYATQMVSAAPPTASVVLQDEAGQPLRIVPLHALLSVGRLPISGLVLDAPMISRSHLQIEWNGSDAHVTDLGSTSGTFVNGVQLPANVATPWKQGQVIQIGPYRLQLHIGAQLAALGTHATTAAALDAAPPPVAQAPAPTRALQAPMPDVSAAPAPMNIPSGLPPLVPDVLAAPPPRAMESPAVTRMLDNSALPSSLRVVTGLSLNVTPGQRAVVSVLAINHAASAERFVVALEGVPAEWVQLPAALAIGAGEQAMASIMVMVPIETTSTARVYPVTIHLNAQSTGVLIDHVVMEWAVLPFTDGRIALDPKRIVGRERAVYRVALTNTGNAPARFMLSADDEEAALECALDTNQVLVEPGETLQLPLKVHAGSRLVGSERRYSFTIKATAPGLRPLTAAGVFAQQAVFSLWMLVIALVILVAIGLLVAQSMGVFSGVEPTITPLIPTPTS